MFFQFDGELKEISVSDIDSTLITAGYVNPEELKRYSTQFGFSESTVQQCLEELRYFRTKIEVYDTYSFGTLKITDAGNVRSNEDFIAFYIKKNFLLLVDIKDGDRSTYNDFSRALRRFPPATITLEKLFFAFIDSLLLDDKRELEDFGFKINRLEQSVLEGDVNKDFNIELCGLKKDMLVLFNYYEQLVDVGEELQENENDLFTEEDLRYFKIFTDKAQKFSDNVRTQRDNLAQLQDAYSAALDIKLNSTMKLFTVITSIFLPLTLVTSWYGMNFRYMPELSWKYSYPCVFAACMLISVICIIIFKKKKLI